MIIPYGRQNINWADTSAVLQTLRSDFLTQGPQVENFEGLLGELTSARYQVATNSATSALHIACLALGVGPGDLVWTSAITFVASANCALYCGAEVDFVDIDPTTLNMSTDVLEAKLLAAESEGKLPKVVIPVHFSGRSADMRQIKSLSERFGFSIIEDASHAIGASYEGLPVGSCTFSDIVVFSFHPVKIITTGEGGAALTNDVDLATEMRLLRSHGITRDKTQMNDNTRPDWYYEQLHLGFNYRMTDFQAALGASQIRRLGKFLKQRRRIAARYKRLLSRVEVKLPNFEGLAESSWHLFVVETIGDAIEGKRDDLFRMLRRAGILVNLHYIPVYRHPYFTKLGFDPRNFPVAEEYYRRAISLPIYAGLTGFQQRKVSRHIVNFLKKK
jgi:UDP-4-amino-4,6-dideoxy-N-acetyl-beta-L-altrosamine transaminase